MKKCALQCRALKKVMMVRPPSAQLYSMAEAHLTGEDENGPVIDERNMVRLRREIKMERKEEDGVEGEDVLVEKQDLTKTFGYGAVNVTVSDADLQAVKVHGEPGISIIGFLPASKVCRPFFGIVSL